MPLDRVSSTRPVRQSSRVRSPRRAGLVLGAAALATAALAGCGSSSTGASSTSAPTSSSTSSSSANASTGSAVITIKDFMFMAPGSVPAGSTVTVKNQDSTSHTVTASGDGGFKVTVAGNSTGTFTAPAKAGDYPFVCTFHGNMKGNLKVA